MSFEDAKTFCEKMSMNLFRLNEKMINTHKPAPGTVGTFKKDKYKMAFSGVIKIVKDRYGQGSCKYFSRCLSYCIPMVL